MNNPDDNRLGRYLRHLRKTLGYSQEYIASALNISRQTYSHYETGRIMPPSHSIMALSMVYGVPLQDLMSLASSDNKQPVFIPNHDQQPIEDMEQYTAYINEPLNISKLRFLSEAEKRLLYYYSQLDKRDKHDIVEFLKIRIASQ